LKELDECDTGAERPRGDSQPEVELFAALDSEPVASILEYVARRLGQDTGNRQMTFWLQEEMAPALGETRRA
jgi:hypothetical protein